MNSSTITTKKGDTFRLSFEFSSDNLAVAFTCEDLTIEPAENDIYSIGRVLFSVISVTDNVMYTQSNSTNAPESSGTLIQITGEGDASIEYTDVSSDDVVNVSGSVITFGVKNIDTDDEYILGPLTCDLIAATAGLAQLLVPADDMDIEAGSYAYEIQVTNQSGEISSSETGLFIIEQDLIRAA